MVHNFIAKVLIYNTGSIIIACSYESIYYIFVIISARRTEQKRRDYPSHTYERSLAIHAVILSLVIVSSKDNAATVRNVFGVIQIQP